MHFYLLLLFFNSYGGHIRISATIGHTKTQPRGCTSELRIWMGCVCVGLLDESFAACDGLFVEGDEVVVTLGQGLAQAANDCIIGYQRTSLEQRAQ